MNIYLDEQTQKNLIAFLQRAQLSGTEVGAFNQAMVAITTPVEMQCESCNKDSNVR